MTKEFPGEKKICSCQEDLLHLIENEDVFNILDEENMKGFNELMKYELITVKEDKVYLTPLGKEAQIHGVKKLIGQKSMQNIAKEGPVAPVLKNRKSYLLWSLFFLFLALLYIVFQDIWP